MLSKSEEKESFTQQPNKDPIENFCFSIIKNEDEIQLNKKVEEMRSEFSTRTSSYVKCVYKTMNK